MNLLQEATFERLLPKYERAFGGPPPFRSATLDEVVEHMRERLRTLDEAGPEKSGARPRSAYFPVPDAGWAESKSRPVH